MYLTIYVLPTFVFGIVYTVSMVIVTVLEVIKVKIVKPRGLAYVFFALLAIAVMVFYIVTV